MVQTHSPSYKLLWRESQEKSLSSLWGMCAQRVSSPYLYQLHLTHLRPFPDPAVQERESSYQD